MGYGLDRGMGYAGSPKVSTLGDIAEEVLRARGKFPGNRFLLVALVEEVGELAESIFNGDADHIAKEATQVACVAIRIREEGDATEYRHDRITIRDLAEMLGAVAKSMLQRKPTGGLLPTLARFALDIHDNTDPTFADVTDAESKP